LTSPDDTIALFAELSLTLAGFAGVVSACSGRERQFRSTELVRLIHVLSASATVLAGCLGFLIGSAGGLSSDQALALGGTVAGPLSAVLLLPLIRKAWRAVSEPDATTERWILLAVPILNIAVILIFGFAIFAQNPFFPLVLGFSIQLMLGLWLFSRLLTRSNQLGSLLNPVPPHSHPLNQKFIKESPCIPSSRFFLAAPRRYF
jgi:hypothetical protein